MVLVYKVIIEIHPHHVIAMLVIIMLVLMQIALNVTTKYVLHAKIVVLHVLRHVIVLVLLAIQMEIVLPVFLI